MSAEPEVRWRLPPSAEWLYCPLCRTALAPRDLDGSLRRACGHCGFVYWEHPQPAATAIVTDGAGRLLYVRRRYPPEPGGWCFPGGGVEFGESAQEAARREVREETGVEVEVGRQLGVFCPPSRASFIAFVAATATGGTLAPGSDALDAGWYLPDKAPPLCFPTHRDALAAWWASGGFAGPGR